MVTDPNHQPPSPNHVRTRDNLVEELIAELHGPSTKGKPYSTQRPIVFADWRESRGPWKDSETGQEILSELTPHQQYGVGVLVPAEDSSGSPSITSEREAISISLPTFDESENELPIDEGVEDRIQTLLKDPTSSFDSEASEADESESGRVEGVFRSQSSLGVSFLIERSSNLELSVEVTAGRYDDFYARFANNNSRQWWVRRPISELLLFSIDSEYPEALQKQTISSPAADPIVTAELSVKTRRFKSDPDLILVTVAITNRSRARSIDKGSLFQTQLRCSLGGKPGILPYPIWNAVQLSDEEKSTNLLFRDASPFAVGHGCAANWTLDPNSSGRASEVCTDTIPSIVLPPITPEIRRVDGTELTFSMRTLAETKNGEFRSQLQELVDSYRDWIDLQIAKAKNLKSDEHKSTATTHLKACQVMADRIEDGISFIESNPKAARAFILANQAMLYQRVRSRKKRTQIFDAKEGRISFDSQSMSLEESLKRSGEANWRPFQLAFLLATMRSAVEGSSDNRETVDLLWFPTGGGKTEAYLGLSAFTIFFRRLQNAEDVGTTVLMRYTLRLLTAQQFQRASALICAMEVLRSQSVDELGTQPIRIGMWVGGGSTPNRSQDAVELLKKMKKHESNLDSSFILDCCPWCGAEMVPNPPRSYRQRQPSHPMKWGYRQTGNTVSVSCTDSSCHFRDYLPISVIDDNLYANPPDFLLGTIDKFAQLAWRDDARALFGLDNSGSQNVSPPSLIIQDELHLIAGPLGSIAGGYEPVIESLCTDRRTQTPIPPKLIASTATIQGYREHVHALFGRPEVALFPPPAIDANESFFARVARDRNGIPITGKRYLGILAPGYKSHQNAISRTIGSMHQFVGQLPPNETIRNPWWTNLLFFGSLRELGNSLTLVSAGIPTFIKHAARRSGRNDRGEQRFIRNAIELTGRLSGSEVPKQLAAIETDVQIDSEGRTGGKAVDLCLATNIIEVGVDVDRLSLMTVVGQPKSMASYIQATGRVGRKWETQPGLVLTVFSPTRARDRSYYEQFRSVHERLYAQVEPTTLTPFAAPALERTLHCAMMAFVRQYAPSGNSPDPVPNELIDKFWAVYSTRFDDLAFQHFLPQARETFQRRRNEWNKRMPTRWDARNEEQVGLAHRAGEYVPDVIRNSSWPVLGSMRNVDADCRISVPWPSERHEEEVPV